jgi:hypothetical protein
MTPDDISDGQFSLLATDDPQEDVVRVAVSTQDMKQAMKPARGTPYKDVRIANKTRLADYGHYRLTACVDAVPGYQYFYFAKPKTDEEKWTAVHTYGGTFDETWPEILEGLRFVEDGSAPIALRAPDANDDTGVGTIFVNRKIAAYVLTPETTQECNARVEIFQADTPFEGLSYPKPNAGHVSWDFGPAGGGSFTALHPRIVIKRPPLQYRVVSDATPGFVDAPYQQDLIFPATQFRTWRPFMRAEPVFEGGLYKLRRLTIYPPPKPKPVYRS